VSAQGEVTQLLQELIRVDTTNPPGNETAAAEVLQVYLASHGVDSELLARVPERANLVARIRGTGEGPSLALLSHTDVVLADAGEWQRDPFGGELVGGEVWGRGALDMKGQVAATAVAVAQLARDGWRPRGDLIFIAAADEEVGDGFGLQWLVESHPDKVRADFSLNEGAGDRVELGDRVLYRCATAEKMSAPFTLRVRGRSGHASMPSIADNALVKAAGYVERLGVFHVAPQLGPETEGFLSVVAGEVPAASAALERARAIHPLAAELIEPLLAMTVTPTMIYRVRQAQRHPRGVRGHGRLPAATRPDSRRRLRDRARVARRLAWSPRRLRARVDRATGRHPFADRRAPVGCGAELP